MLKCLLAPLLETLRPHFDLSKTRLETLAVLLVGLANGRTVNLSHLASQFPGDAQHGSNYRRLQRAISSSCSWRQRHSPRKAGRANAEPQAAEAPPARPYINWKLGSRDVNVLVLAVAIVARTNGAPMATHATVSKCR